MFIIDLRNALVSNYRFSVMNNNDEDEVQIFSFLPSQENYSCYLKVMSDDETFADKVAIDNEHKEVIDDALVVKWLMSKDFTQFKQIRIQLQFEANDESGTIIAQSRIVTITLNDTLPVDGRVNKLYPNVLKALEDRVAQLEARVKELEER